MSNLSELLPAGAGAKSAEFVASGTLSSGVTVSLNSDGTVSASFTGLGAPVAFFPSYASLTTSTFDSNSNKIVIVFQDQATVYGTAVVGTVSGTSISFGTPVVFESSTTLNISPTFDSNSNKVVVAYRSSSRGRAKVGTVSGTSISFGGLGTFRNGNTDNISIAFDSNSNKVVIAYRDLGDFDGYAIVGTVSGTSISFGAAAYTAARDTTLSTTTVFDTSSNKIVVAFTNSNNSNYGTAVVGTVNGTSISFGSKVVFNSASSNYNSATFDSNSNKVVIAYTDQGNSNYGTAVVGTVSGTSISFGTPVVFENANSDYLASAFNSNTNNVVITYRDLGVGTTNIVQGTVSGASISFETPIAFLDYGISNMGNTFDSNSNKIVVSYRDFPSSSIVVEEISNNLANFIGITDQAIADTATGAVIVQGGVSDKVSSLTAGSDYYVQDDGTLSTTVSSVPAGRALSTTSILLEG